MKERETNVSKYVEPRKQVEKQRVFEFVTKFLSIDSKSPRLIDQSFISQISTNLVTQLKKDQPTSKNTTDDQHLHSVIEDINDSLNSENSPMTLIDSSTLCDDFEDDQIENCQENVINDISPIHKYSLVSIIDKGREEMVNQNYQNHRLRKKLRVERNDYCALRKW